MLSQSPADTLRSAATGLSAHLVYQVTARLFSFIIKAVVVRAMKPAQYAFVEIRVILLVSLALLPATTGFRFVSLRVQSDQRAIALASFNTFFTLFLAFLLGSIAIAIDPSNSFALVLVMVSIFIRAFVELPIIFARRYQLYIESSRARAISIIVSGLSQTIAVSLITSQSFAAPASSTGHIAYVITLGIAIRSALATAGHSLPIISVSHLSTHLYREDLVMAFVATGEGFIKFLLENGEAIILDICCTANVKGAYKIAANLGSVFARFFSEALEEQAFNVFSKLSPAYRSTSNKPDDNENGSTSPQSESAQNDVLATRAACEDMLILGLKAAISISFLFAIVGPPYAYAVVRLLYGEAWAGQTSAPTILSLYLVYLTFMAGNGVSEAFVTASATTRELKARTKYSTSLSIAYLMALYYAARNFGANGIIIVNCANMALRMSYSAWFFRKLTGRPLRTLLKALPHPFIFAVAIGCRFVSRLSEHHFLGPFGNRIVLDGKVDMLSRVLAHGASGILAVGLFALAFRTFERESFSKPFRAFRNDHED